jgi:Domain of unknown function (DUF4386)
MRIFSERQPVVALIALAMVVLEVVASVLFLAVYDFDLGAPVADPGVLPARGPEVATLLRWATIVDMLGYLALAPIVLYVHSRLRDAVAARGGAAWSTNVLAFGGLGFALVGSLGAVLYASVGPVLLQASAGGSPTATAAAVGYSALATGVNVGLWGTLEWVLLGVWLIGTGWLVRSEGWTFGWLGMVAGVGGFVYAARSGLTGHPPADLTSPLDLVTFVGFALFFVWMLWLAVRLWQGR